MTRKKVAVFFGGKSFEHDVSILTGIQVCQAMDRAEFEPIPVYEDIRGRLWTGEALLDTGFYPLTESGERRLSQVFLPVGEGTAPSLRRKKLLGCREIAFDIAFPAFHGACGESGAFQGMCEIAGIPYAGASSIASTIYMSKIATKRFSHDLGLNVLPETLVARRQGGFDEIAVLLKPLEIKYPAIVKPESLGSSVGVRRVDDFDSLCAAILAVWSLGAHAMIEPFVENLVEYSIAVVKNEKGETLTSAIESPHVGEGGRTFSFADKYLAEAGAEEKAFSFSALESLVNARREFSPKLSKAKETLIRNSARTLFEALGGGGAPRIDFLSNKETGEIWFSEANPIPSFFAFFLWDKKGISLRGLTSMLLARPNQPPPTPDLNQGGSAIFKE